MSTVMQMNEGAAQAPAFTEVLQKQRLAFEKDRNPSPASRIAKLKALAKALQDNRPKIIAALNRDFGHRPTEVTRIAEIGASVGHIEYAVKHLHGWMRPRRRGTSMWFLPGSNRIEPQPLGVVGIMAPWNYPINLAVAPLVSALAAGNRAMIKMSEYTPASTRVLQEILAPLFDESEVAVFGGDARDSSAFSALPFDHLLFTGSTHVGRMVAAAAAPNLTPLTLELGGKSPVIIDDDYSIKEAASRILWGKTFNSGQTCVAPDYILLPKGKLNDFVIEMSRHYRAQFPNGAASDDYTSVIDQRNYDRLNALLETAQAGGTKAVAMEPHSDALAAKRKFPMTLLLNPSFDSRVMREEIFGPVLPVIEVDSVDEAIQQINAGDRPLALYFFGHSERNQEKVLKGTHAGGVTINDVMLQYLQVSQPFGGVGASGYGSYHGLEGFETFSHLKSVFSQRGFGSFTGLKLLYPPYGHIGRRLIGMMGG